MRKALGLLALAALAACSVGRRATDPEATLPAIAPLPEITAAEPLPEEPAVAVASTATAAATTTTNGRTKTTAGGTAPTTSASRKSWGLVTITTAIVSPSQLMGRELPYDPSYKKLPVFPEKITLQVSWGLLDVGEATLSVKRIVSFNGRPAYHLVSEARSNAFCDTFYRVRDLNESWLDARTLTSLGYSKKLREGGFFRDEWVLYDRDANTFVARRTNKDGTFAVRAGTIPASVQDILSSIYFVRAQELKVGGEVVVDVNTPDNWPLSVKVKERESVKTHLGKRPAVLVEPEMRREGLFVQKGKRLRLWLSDDAEKRPLLMKVEVFFGHVTASLREML
ncbi:MAG: DUF3108 domain-containing protein [Elusimicrobiota bacterium]|nr:DUF3108 domain-containing protein [Elusimicrobiota bacterium]